MLCEKPPAVNALTAEEMQRTRTRASGYEPIEEEFGAATPPGRSEKQEEKLEETREHHGIAIMSDTGFRGAVLQATSCRYRISYEYRFRTT